MASVKVNEGAAGVAALVLVGRTLSLLADKNVITLQEGLKLVHQTHAEIGGDDPEFRAAAQHALASVFPTAGL